MKKYIGTKIIKAKPESQNNRDGYAVEYEDGYKSWSPKEAFENAYRETIGMSFGLAFEAMKRGLRVARAGWNGKGMFLFLVPGSTFKVNRPPLLGIYEEGTEINYHPHIDMRTATGEIVPWFCSQTDMFADDWVFVETLDEYLDEGTI